MKKIFAIALMMTIIACGVTASAQTQATATKDKTEQCDKSRKCDGKDKKGKKEGARKLHAKGQRPDLFAGITLTPEQKTQLDALKAERKADKAERKADKAKRKADKAERKADKAKMSKEDRQARRAAFDAKVKGILTPDQWAVYQKNVEDMKANRQKKGA